MAFYEYYQNNSGGSFIDPAYLVVVEANSACEADALAEFHGVYFDVLDEDGEYSRDCSCCGARWSSAYGEGADVPTYYGEPLDEHTTDEESQSSWFKKDYLVVYKDGTEERGFLK